MNLSKLLPLPRHKYIWLENVCIVMFRGETDKLKKKKETTWQKLENSRQKNSNIQRTENNRNFFANSDKESKPKNQQLYSNNTKKLSKDYSNYSLICQVFLLQLYMILKINHLVYKKVNSTIL